MLFIIDFYLIYIIYFYFIDTIYYYLLFILLFLFIIDFYLIDTIFLLFIIIYYYLLLLFIIDFYLIDTIVNNRDDFIDFIAGERGLLYDVHALRDPSGHDSGRLRFHHSVPGSQPIAA